MFWCFDTLVDDSIRGTLVRKESEKMQSFLKVNTPIAKEIGHLAKWMFDFAYVSSGHCYKALSAIPFQL